MARASLIAWLALVGAAHGQGSVTATCVEVLDPGGEAEGLERLVIDELDRHTTHRSATEDCGSYLRVELIEVGPRRWVTGRINTQVPHRVRVENDDLEAAIVRMLRVVLHNDPVRLRGPRDRNWLQSAIHDLRRGRNLYGVEAFQVSALVDGRLSGVPGVAFSFRRELERWHLGARIGFGWRLGETAALDLTGHVDAQLQVAWFFSEAADASGYLAGLMGVEHLRFQGPSPLADGQSEPFNATGFGVGLRTGVELFRTTRARLDLFGQAVLPAFVAHDEESETIDEWVPTFTFGAGVVF